MCRIQLKSGNYWNIMFDNLWWTDTMFYQFKYTGLIDFKVPVHKFLGTEAIKMYVW